MRSAPRPEPVGEAEEVRLVDAVQHLDDGALGDLVLQAGDAERPLPPVRLGDVHPPRRLGSVCPAVQPPVQISEVLLQVLPVVLPRLAVHPRRRLRLDRPVGVVEALHGDVVQERCELRILVPFRNLSHAVQRMWHAHAGPVSGACFAGRVPLGRPPFLHRLRGHGLVRRLRRYYGAVRLPVLVHPRLAASAFPERPCPVIGRTGEGGISRFSRTKVRRMPWFSDSAGSACGSRVAPPTVWPSAGLTASAPRMTLISELNSPAYACPCQRFPQALAGRRTWLGVAVDRYSFDVKLLHLLLRAGLSRRYQPTGLPPLTTAPATFLENR